MWSMKKEGMKESREMYLKTIFHLNRKLGGHVRNVDIANNLNVSRASVTRAIYNMCEENLVIISAEGWIRLTEQGEKEATLIADRYNTIVTYLCEHLDLKEELVCMDACQIEHIISDDLYEAMKENILREKKGD